MGHGALTMAVYSTRDDVIERAIEVAEDVGVALSINLTGNIFVNQSAAFSDFHGTEQSGREDAALTDAAYVANRFRVVRTARVASARRHERARERRRRSMNYEQIRFEVGSESRASR